MEWKFHPGLQRRCELAGEIINDFKDRSNKVYTVWKKENKETQTEPKRNMEYH